ncbi:unnamed protein product, partial [Amoebophrya sp. A25]
RTLALKGPPTTAGSDAGNNRIGTLPVKMMLKIPTNGGKAGIDASKVTSIKVMNDANAQQDDINEDVALFSPRSMSEATAMGPLKLSGLNLVPSNVNSPRSARNMHTPRADLKINMLNSKSSTDGAMVDASSEIEKSLQLTSALSSPRGAAVAAQQETPRVRGEPPLPVKNMKLQLAGTTGGQNKTKGTKTGAPPTYDWDLEALIEAGEKEISSARGEQGSTSTVRSITSGAKNAVVDRTTPRTTPGLLLLNTAAVEPLTAPPLKTFGEALGSPRPSPRPQTGTAVLGRVKATPVPTSFGGTISALQIRRAGPEEHDETTGKVGTVGLGGLQGQAQGQEDNINKGSSMNIFVAAPSMSLFKQFSFEKPLFTPRADGNMKVGLPSDFGHHFTKVDPPQHLSSTVQNKGLGLLLDNIGSLARPPPKPAAPVASFTTTVSSTSGGTSGPVRASAAIYQPPPRQMVVPLFRKPELKSQGPLLQKA